MCITCIPACTGHERRSPCLEVSQIGSLLQHCRRLRKPCISHWSPEKDGSHFSVYSSLAPQHFVTRPVAVLIREAHQNGLSDLLGTGHGPILGQRWKPMVSPRFPSEVYRLQFLETPMELIIAPRPFLHTELTQLSPT